MPTIVVTYQPMDCERLNIIMGSKRHIACQLKQVGIRSTDEYVLTHPRTKDFAQSAAVRGAMLWLSSLSAN